MKTICLNMIVKNESHVIVNTFDNILKYIKLDYWVISDTGSTDNTIDVIKTYFKEKNIPGEIVNHEWKDFGHNRTKALESAYNKTDYLLIFDADDSFHGDFKLPQLMNADSYHLKFGKHFTYLRPQIVNNRKKWEYRGVLHEFIVCLDPTSPHEVIQGDYFIDSGKTGDRSKDPDKYLKDALILSKAFENEPDQGLKCRYAFYCAQSYKDYNKPEEAITWYKKCLNDNWHQEKYFSCLMIAEQNLKLNNLTESLKYWIKSSEYDSERIDGIVNACDYLRNNDMHLLVNLLYHKYKNYNKYPKEKLFLYQDKYFDILEFNNSISAFYANDPVSGYECSRKIIINNIAPIHIINMTFSNILFYDIPIDDELFQAIRKFIQNNSQINPDLFKVWEKTINYQELTKPSKKVFKNKPKPKILISFTTCKRFDLFKKTINSILNNWTDVDLIDYWFCVDDNSSNDDRKMMKNFYKWIDFYNKTPDEKGHRNSMNIIWDKLNELKPDYWIHMEDDFLFHEKMDYITTSIKYLNELKSQNIHQILFNRNYAETISDYKIVGHLPYNDEIVIHEHKNGTFHYSNCHYWPHYSFRPSMIRTETILNLGNYDSPNQFFEMDYANKWTDNGYKSAFFNKITCRHIGKLTSEKDKPNAYTLNNEGQFNHQKINKIKVINLLKRTDRKENVIKKFKEAKITKYEFIEATDGYLLKPTYQIAKLFKGNDFGNRKGVIGCAITHVNLWKELLKSEFDYFLIMEDDFTITDKFKNEIEKINFTNYEILLMGYHMFSNIRESLKNIYENNNDVQIENLKMNNYIGGIHCYSINKNGARKLIDYIEKNGIKHGIDYLFKIIPELECWETVPHIAFADWNENGKIIDSNIQNLYDGFDFSEFDIEKNFIFIPEKDQISNDIYYKRDSLENMLETAHNDSNCVAFNTLGFFKNKINNLTSSRYFKKNDGIYIKRNYYETLNKTKIKMICNWCSSEQLCKEWSNMCEKNLIWKNFLLTSDEEADFYVIINKPNNSYYDPSKTIVFQMEPWVNDENKNWGVKTWGEWANPDENKFFHVHTHKNYLNNVQWQINPPSEFPENRKNKLISILSEKYFDDGHIKRINFIKKLEENCINFVDVYGRENYHDFKNYVGKTDKSDFKNYKYCFSVENNYETNYASEKIWEPILHEMLTFYWGCPNLENYIDSDAFVRLDIDNYDESIKIIEKAINEDWWSNRIDIIKKEKQKILNKLGFFPTLEKIIQKKCFITGCIYNNEKYLKKVFNNIDNLIKLFDDYFIVVAYDDSEDNSLKILQEMKNKYKMEIIVCSKNNTYTCQNICDARNKILNYIRKNNENNFNYIISMDMDDVCSEEIDIENIKKILNKKDWDAISFNRDDYYDIWALSLEPYVVSCQHWQDWHDVCSSMKNFINERLEGLNQEDLLDVYSAFNGFSIYKLDKFINCDYECDFENNLSFFTEEMIKNNENTLNKKILNKLKVDCEHRHFHLEAIKKNNAKIKVTPLKLLKKYNKYVSSRGILQSCSIKSSTPHSSINYLLDYNFEELYENATVYVCSNAINDFINNFHKIDKRIILITGDCDESVPDDIFKNNDEFINFIESDKIIHWFSQNCVGNHPKLSGIPIGLDYHTLSKGNHEWGEMISPIDQELQLVEIKKDSLPFYERQIKCYSNFHFLTSTRYGFDRIQAIYKIPKELVFYEPDKIKRYNSWKNQSNYAFVISPHGNGLDCHRTWEALCLGCIPIVKKSPIDYLYEDLPVLIVDEWIDIDEELLKKTIEDFKNRTFNYEKLNLEYWLKKINFYI